MIAVASWGDNYHSWIAGGVTEYELETLRFLSSAGCNSWFSYHTQSLPVAELPVFIEARVARS